MGLLSKEDFDFDFDKPDVSNSIDPTASRLISR